MDQHTAFPDLLGRHDAAHGTWEVRTGTMGPGMAWTELGNRRMNVPHGDTPNERSVRAHEMVHAKVSPQPMDMLRWLARGKASPEAHTAAEELRVNTLVKRAGFDVDCLTDGGETQAGEFVAENNRWSEAVMATCAYAGTGRFRSFLVGVRRHNPEWAKTLRALHDRLVKELERVPNDVLASTAVDRKSGLSPLGYAWTEAIAQLIDHAATPPEPPADDPNIESDDDGDERAEQEKPGDKPDEKPAPKPPVAEDQIKKMKLEPDTGFWDEVRWGDTHRNRRAPGGIGKTKKPSSIGRAPTRIGRLLTDPHQRVFDRKRPGKGGVVLIDASASMRFSQDDVKAITEAAPGCTVAMYCGNSRTRNEGKPNMWLLADRGSMVAEIPERTTGNGVDLPALEWAVSARQRKDSPVVWITDGAVHGPGQNYTNDMAVACAKTCLRSGVVVRPNVKTALEVLTLIGAGKKVQRKWPHIWMDSWQAKFGRRLPGTTFRG